MSFFENQIAAKRRTGLLIGYFIMAVIMIICAIYAAVSFIFISAGASDASTPFAPLEEQSFWNLDLFIGVTCITLIIVVLGSVYKTFMLSGGGAQVATYLGGELVLPSTSDPNQRRLLNIVEEVSIASGVSIPPVYLLKHELGINAFAAGFAINDAVIGVTQGCINILSRDELQGVIAHEFSHVLNGDMRLNLRLIGVLHGILLIGITGYWLLRSSSHRGSSRDGKGRGAIALFGLALFIIGYIGVFFGHLIKAAVSRQREFLADASAVQFTRNPYGIGGALAKIGGLVQGSHIENANAEEASHLFFSNGLTKSFLDLLSTHPPLLERIKKIDPSFKGQFPDVDPTENIGLKEALAFDAGTAGIQQLAPSSEPARFAVTPETVVESVGTPSTEHLSYASSLLAALPIAVLQDTRDPYGARAVVYCLLLDQSDDLRQRQLDYLSQHETDDGYEHILKTYARLKTIHPEMRLPLVDLCLPSLRLLSAEQYLVFRDCLKFLANADDHCSLFEYALHHILLQHTDIHFEMHTAKEQLSFSAKEISHACVDLLATLAASGHAAPQERELAFRAALAIFKPKAQVPFDATQAGSLDKLDQALTVLEHAEPRVKEKILRACTISVAFDNFVTIEEAELIRTIGDALDCPIPPFLPNQQLTGREV
ncbi:M48 family metallopeptidase [Oligoflexia bacterium]|nr:M48 family metallopeptidase [Oligoflexia bacterium]